MNRLMKYFKFEHLPANLQVTSSDCALLAIKVDDDLPESAEKTAGLRKLLEAKDCFVRAKLDDIENKVPKAPGVPEGENDG